MFNFEDLKELIIIDQINRRLPLEMREHFIDDLYKVVKKLYGYEAAKRNIKTINGNAHNFEIKEHKIRKSENYFILITKIIG